MMVPWKKLCFNSYLPRFPKDTLIHTLFNFSKSLLSNFPLHFFIGSNLLRSGNCYDYDACHSSIHWVLVSSLQNALTCILGLIMSTHSLISNLNVTSVKPSPVYTLSKNLRCLLFQFPTTLYTSLCSALIRLSDYSMFTHLSPF